jgi:mannose-6-phosphate isomerase-like protein (cupin superfamily)
MRQSKTRVNLGQILVGILTVSKKRGVKSLAFAHVAGGIAALLDWAEAAYAPLEKESRSGGTRPTHGALSRPVVEDRAWKALPHFAYIALNAMVFSVGLEFFFTDDPKRRVVAIVRRKERQRFPEKPDAGEVAFHFECLDFPAVERKLNAYYSEFRPLDPAKVRLHQHPGIEFMYLIRGKLELRIGEEENSLEKGDAIYFDSNLPHGYRRIGNSLCAALVVTAVTFGGCA